MRGTVTVRTVELSAFAKFRWMRWKKQIMNS